MCRSAVNRKRLIIVLSVLVTFAALLTACAVPKITGSAARKTAEKEAELFDTTEESEIVVTGVPQSTTKAAESNETTTKTNSNSDTLTQIADNDVTFSTSKSETMHAAAQSTTQKEKPTQSQTDAEGWIDKWY